MRVFILEDDWRRMEFFLEALDGHEVDRAESVADAVAMYKPPYDLILLDHDLGGEQFVSSDHDNTGYQFAKHLAQNHTCGQSQVIVHSWNMGGARRMVEVLKRVGWTVEAEPFGSTLLRVLRGDAQGANTD